MGSGGFPYSRSEVPHYLSTRSAGTLHESRTNSARSALVSKVLCFFSGEGLTGKLHREEAWVADTVRSGDICRAPDEQWKIPSPAEERFDRAGRTPGLFVVPMAFLVLYSAPLPWALDQQILGVIPTFTVVDWLSEAMLISAMTILALTVCVGSGIGGLLTLIGALPDQVGTEFVEQETNVFATFYGWVIPMAPIVPIPPNRLIGLA